MRGDINRRLTILSEAEKTALYDLPAFDNFQRVEFFAMTDAERSLALQRRGIVKQVCCLLQIGYFKAKQAFFHFTLDDVPPEDITFLLQRYFPDQTLTATPLTTSEYYVQRNKIVHFTWQLATKKRSICCGEFHRRRGSTCISLGTTHFGISITRLT